MASSVPQLGGRRLPRAAVGREQPGHPGQRQDPPHERSRPDQPQRAAVRLDAPPRIDQHPDPGAIQEADLRQVDDQLVAAAVDQLDHNGLELRAGGQVDLAADLDRGTVAVALDAEVELHHRYRFLVTKRCPGSPWWWDLGSGRDGSGTATETPPCPCGPARRGPGTLLPAPCPVCALLVPATAAVPADRVVARPPDGAAVSGVGARCQASASSGRSLVATSAGDGALVGHAKRAPGAQAGRRSGGLVRVWPGPGG
jgi:hypothetical protein